VSFTNDCYLQQALQEIVRANPHFAVEVVAVPDSQDGFIAFDVAHEQLEERVVFVSQLNATRAELRETKERLEVYARHDIQVKP